MQFVRLKPVWHFLGRYKYIITIAICTAIVVFIDENSYLRRWEYNLQITDLKSEINMYKSRYERDSAQLYELKNIPSAITKVARERYFMKADDEDIYVLSDDNKEYNTDETVK